MRVVIIGAGLSGLFTASELIHAGHEDVLLVDRLTAPGGIARTIHQEGFALEPAAGSVTLPHPFLTPILERAGVAMSAARPDAHRYVYSADRLVELPPSPRAALTPLLSTRAKLRALAEPLVTRAGAGDETLLDFCRRRFGADAGSLLAWLMATGVYAGDPEQLSASSTFPRLVALEEQSGSVLRGVMRRRRGRPTAAPRPHVPVGGMSALAEAISSSIGGRYVPGFEVESVRQSGREWVVRGTGDLVADAVVLTSHPRHAAFLLDDELSGHLRMAKSAPVATVGIGAHGQAPFPNGFGALVTPDSLMVSRGFLFESSYAPERSPAGSWLLKVIVGGTPFSDVVSWEDDRLLEVVGAEAGRIFGADVTPQFGEVVRHETGIPQYDVGHGDWLRQLDRLLGRRPGLHVSGWGYGGVGVTDLATDAARVATTLGRGSAEQFG